jgi:hypothetical protein
MDKILWDKTRNQQSMTVFFIDCYGDAWIDSDPFSASMSGWVKIMRLPKDHYRYEIRNTEDSFIEKYSEFCIECDRKKLPIIKFNDYLKQFV